LTYNKSIPHPLRTASMTPNPFLEEANAITAEEWALAERLFQEAPKLVKIPRGNKEEAEHRNQYKKSFRQRIQENFSEADATAIITTLKHSFVKLGDTIYAQLPQRGAFLGEGGQATIKLVVGKKIGAPVTSVNLNEPQLLRIDKKSAAITEDSADEIAASMDLGLIIATASRQLSDLDPDIDGTQHYSLMPYLGRDSREWITAIEPPSEGEPSQPSASDHLKIAAKLVWQVIALHQGYQSQRGLPYAHRDIKPENIVIDGEWLPRLIDFGIACNEPHRFPSHTGIGTVAYQMPFEQCEEQTNAVLDLTGLLRSLYLPEEILDGSGFKMKREKCQPTFLTDDILRENKLQPSLFLPELVVKQGEPALLHLACDLALSSIGLQEHMQQVSSQPLAQQALMVMLHSDHFDTDSCLAMLTNPTQVQMLSVVAPLMSVFPASTIKAIIEMIIAKPEASDWFNILEENARQANSIANEVRYGHFLLRQIVSLTDEDLRVNLLQGYAAFITAIDAIEADHKHINLFRFFAEQLLSGKPEAKEMIKRIINLNSPVARHLAYRMMRPEKLSEVQLCWLELLDQSPALDESTLICILEKEEAYLGQLLDIRELSRLVNNSRGETLQALLTLVQSNTPVNAHQISVLHALNRHSDLSASQRLVLATCDCIDVYQIYKNAPDWRRPLLPLAVAKPDLNEEIFNQLTNYQKFRAVGEKLLPFIEVIPASVKMALINECLTHEPRHPWADTLSVVCNTLEHQRQQEMAEIARQPGKGNRQRQLTALDKRLERQRGLLLKEMDNISQFGSSEWSRLALGWLRREPYNLQRIEAFAAVDKLSGIDYNLLYKLEVKANVQLETIPVFCVLNAIGVMDIEELDDKKIVAENVLLLLDNKKHCDGMKMIWRLMQVNEHEPIYCNSRLPTKVVAALSRYVTSSGRAFYAELFNWFSMRMDKIQHSQCEESQQAIDTMISRLNSQKGSIDQLTPAFTVIAFNGLICNFTHDDQVIGARETMLEMLVHLSQIPGLTDEIQSKGINTLFSLVGLLCSELYLLQGRVGNDAEAQSHLAKAIALRDTLITTQLDNLLIAEVLNPNAVKVVTDKDGYAMYFSRATIPWDRDNFAGQQQTIAQPLMRHIGIYAYRTGFLHRFCRPASGSRDRSAHFRSAAIRPEEKRKGSDPYTNAL